MENKKGNKSGQVTIFIIVGILIVAGILAAIYFLGGFDVQLKGGAEPRQFIDKCIREAVEPSVERVLAGGGRVNPSFFKMYDGEIYNYLCYQKDYYLGCINTHPKLKAIVEEEIKQDSQKRVEQCFIELKDEYENRGFGFSGGNLDFDIELAEGLVLIKVEKQVDIVKGEKSQSFDDFDGRVLSHLYELVEIAHEIVNQEAKYCNFEYNGFMLLYPKYKIRRIDYDETKIYKVIDRNSGEEFKFAVRSCALPPGL